MLEGKQLVKSASGQKIIDNIDIQLAPGEIAVVIGPSGSGKTTLLKLLALLEKPDSGKIVIDGKQYSYPSEHNDLPPWPKITVVFQQLFLWPHLTLLQNIKLPLQLASGGRPRGSERRQGNVHSRASTSASEQAADQRAEGAGTSASVPAADQSTESKSTEIIEQRRLEDLLALFDMEGFVHRYPNEASLGQRQRAALVRALVLKPDYLLLDEITSSLDVEQISIILSYLKRLSKKGIGVLIVTHLLNFAREAADKVIFIDSGQIIESGGREVLDCPSQERVKKFLSVIQSAS